MMPVNLAGHLGEPLRRPVRLAVVGAGARGSAYAELAARRPDRAAIVAVAEPSAPRREAFAARHGLGRDVYADWRELARRPRLADAVIVATQDADHQGPVEAFAALGYDLLLEKPMAPAEEGCEAIAVAVRGAGVAAVVCHVMRYTPYTRRLVELVRAGTIGEIVSVQHLEPIGFYHFAHSYVRGNWRRSDESSSLLLAKSCHDIDWLGHVIGRPVRRVSSFGSRSHFRPERRPDGAAERCLECPVEPRCAYSAPRMYLAGLREPGSSKEYFARVAAGQPAVLTEEGVLASLADGPYGRCVYACDNDVVDHQVVNLEYEGGATASFTLTAFTPKEDRRTRIFGTAGQLAGDGRTIEHYDFDTERTEVIDTGRAAGHGGGDAGLITAFVDALHGGRPELIVSGVEESLASHRVVFAAERARLRGTVETLVSPGTPVVPG